MSCSLQTITGQTEYYSLGAAFERNSFGKGLPNESLDYYKFRTKRNRGSLSKRQKYSLAYKDKKTLGDIPYKHAKLQSKSRIIVQGLNDFYGVIDTLFNPILPIVHEDIYQFWDNKAWLLKQNNKWSLVDSLFTNIGTYKFDQVYIISDEFFMAKIEYNTFLCHVSKGIIKDLGSWVYFKANFNKNPQYLIIKKRHPDRKYLCNNEGKDIFELKDGDRIQRCFPSTTKAFKIRRNRKTGLVSEDGSIIIPNNYRSIRGLNYNDSGTDLFFETYMDGKRQLFKNKDSILISDEEIYRATTPNYLYHRPSKHRKNKYYIYSLNAKKGFYNCNSNYVSEPKYDKIIQWEDDKIVIQIEGLYGVIDSLENVIIPAVYEDFHMYQSSVIAIKDSKHSLLGLDGSLLIPPIYDHLSFSKNSSGNWNILKFRRGEIRGIFNTNFKEIIN